MGYRQKPTANHQQYLLISAHPATCLLTDIRITALNLRMSSHSLNFGWFRLQPSQLQSNISYLLMARQRQKRPLQDDVSPPERLQNSHASKRIKKYHQLRQRVQAYLSSCLNPSQDCQPLKEGTTVDLSPFQETELGPAQTTPHIASTLPLSPPSDEHNTVTPASTEIAPLTRGNLKSFLKNLQRADEISSDFSSSRPSLPPGSPIDAEGTEPTTIEQTKTTLGRVKPISNVFKAILKEHEMYLNGKISMLADREELQRVLFPLRLIAILEATIWIFPSPSEKSFPT